MMKKSLAFATTLLAATFSLHTIASSAIALKGGTIHPGKTLKISLAKLIDGANYSVVCELDNANEEKVAMRVDTDPQFDSFFDFTVDGMMYWDQFDINEGEHEISFHNVTKHGFDGKTLNLTIQNLDFDNNVTLKDCIASPSTWGY